VILNATTEALLNATDFRPNLPDFLGRIPMGSNPESGQLGLIGGSETVR